MKAGWFWVLCVSATVLFGCSSAKVGEECEETDDCDDGLICPKAGVYQGHCTTECDESDHCSTTHGSDYFCHVDHVCVQECFAATACPGNMSCDFSGSPSHCAAN